MDQIKDKKKIDWIGILPALILIVAVGTITKYNIMYTVLAGVVGALISRGLKRVLKKK